MTDPLRLGLLNDGRILVSAGEPGRAAASRLTPAEAREAAERLVQLAEESEKLHAPVIVPAEEDPVVTIEDGGTLSKATVTGPVAVVPGATDVTIEGVSRAG